MKLVIFVAGFLCGALLADVSHPTFWLEYSAPVQTSYEQQDIDFMKRMMRK